MTGVRLTAFRVSLLSTLIVVLLYVWAAQSTLLRNLEAKALDLRFHLRGMKQPGAPIILVAIDDRSIAELGRWPWSRRRFAEIVQRLHAAGRHPVRPRPARPTWPEHPQSGLTEPTHAALFRAGGVHRKAAPNLFQTLIEAIAEVR